MFETASRGGATSSVVFRSRVNGRENNEDSFAVFEITVGGTGHRLTVLTVADGMGGHEHGEDASREAIRRLALTLFERLAIDRAVNVVDALPAMTLAECGKVLLDGVAVASHHVRRMVEVNRWGRAGSTIVVAIVAGDEAIVSNLGDSPLFYRPARDGKLVQVTDDHTVAGALQRAGLITSEMARHHEGRSQLEFYLGMSRAPSAQPLYHLRLATDDVLLLCSDGIAGALTIAEIERILADASGLDAAADRLLASATEAGETDNQTVILWRHAATGAPCLPSGGVSRDVEVTQPEVLKQTSSPPVPRDVDSREAPEADAPTGSDITPLLPGAPPEHRSRRHGDVALPPSVPPPPPEIIRAAESRATPTVGRPTPGDEERRANRTSPLEPSTGPAAPPASLSPPVVTPDRLRQRQHDEPDPPGSSLLGVADEDEPASATNLDDVPQGQDFHPDEPPGKPPKEGFDR